MFVRKVARRSLCLIAAAAAAAVSPAAHAQGCVAAHGTGMCGIHGIHGDETADDYQWEGSVSYRWLNSHRHFTGDHEDRNRAVEGSEVKNNSNFIDASITYYATPRYNFTFTAPFVSHSRSQTVVIGGVRQRFSTQAAGLSDIRLNAHAWILDPASPTKWNVMVGLGFDAPTGEKDAKDIFIKGARPDGTLIGAEQTVDQSIQPGDGGWGITLDVYAYYQFTEKLTGFANGAYTITPEETAWVPTFRSRASEAFMSIADSYLGRLGVEYSVWQKYGLTFSLANRIEGVPVYDLIGGSNWFRRPGYSISVEPGVMANVHGWKLALYTPIAFYNNRERSVPDIQDDKRGDAAFADYQVLFSIAHGF